MKFHIIFFDFEATSKYPTRAQPCQLSAVAIDPYRLKLIENGVFNSYIRPEFDDKKAEELGLAPFSQEFTDITGITRDKLESAPDLKTVWTQFQEYCNRFNPKQSPWTAPVKAGANILGYDNIIIDRICGGHYYEVGKESFRYKCQHCETELVSEKERKVCSNCKKRQMLLLNSDKTQTKRNKIWGYGPWDSEREEETLFNRRFQIDIMQVAYQWFESDDTIRSLSFDSMRQMFGMDTEHSHNSLFDIIQGAYCLCKFLSLTRQVYNDVQFDGAFEHENKEIARLVKAHWK